MSNSLIKPERCSPVRQPNYFARFQCIGSECEDTCCEGSTVVIDKQTYLKYRDCVVPDLKMAMEQSIVVNPSSTNDITFAYISGSDSGCPFLNSKHLCEIQCVFGEEYLSRTCHTFPRMYTNIDGVFQRTLSLSCPEAARLLLLDPGAAEMQYLDSEADPRFSGFPSIDTLDESFSSIPYVHLSAVSKFVIGLLTNRHYTQWERLVILGIFTDRLDKLSGPPSHEEIPALVATFEDAALAGEFRPTLDQIEFHPAVQLNFVVTALEHRVLSQQAGGRFLDCVTGFMRGLEYTGESTPVEGSPRYVDAYWRFLQPFLESHEHVFENYLVNSVLTTVFPFGPQHAVYKVERTAFENYLVLVCHFVLIRGLLTGIAADRKDEFGDDDVVRAIQSYVKAVEHNPAYVATMLKTMIDNGFQNMGLVAVLLKI